MAFQGKNKAVTFSYDDGMVQDIKLIELMNQYGIKATFNINSERLGAPALHEYKDHTICRYRIRREDIRKIYEGHELAVHTLTHPRLTTLEEQEVIYQVEQDRLNLSELAGYEVVGMAYPCGGVNNDDRVAEIIRKHTGVKYSRTITCNGSFAPQENLFRFDPTVYHLHWDEMMALGQQFVELKTDTPAVFYIWGHSYELDYKLNYWNKLEEFFRLIGNRDDIFYGTNREVLLAE